MSLLVLVVPTHRKHAALRRKPKCETYKIEGLNGGAV